MDTKDYIRIFEQSSELLVVIDTNFAIVAASDAFLKTTLTVREQIMGREFFDVFPENPDDKTANEKSKVIASFERVIKNKTEDALPVVKYDIPKPESEGGGFEVKYWKAIHSPVLDEKNNVKYIIQRTKDVTENTRLITQHEREQKALKMVEASEKRYNTMLMESPFGFAIFKGKNMVITLANDSIKIFWGKGNDLEGKSLFDVIPELRDSEFPILLDEVYTTGVPFHGEEILAPIFRNGKMEDVYFNFVYQPYWGSNETISGVTVIAYEITASVLVKKRLEAQQEMEQKALKLVEDTSNRYYTMLMDSPFAFSIMKGKDMVITLANDLIKEFWGKGNEVEGKKLLQVLPELKDQPFPEMLNSVYTTGIPVYVNEIPARLQHKDKMEERYFNVAYQPDHQADGTISGVITIAYDVTEMVLARKIIEESEKHLRQVLDSMPQKITNADTEGNVIYFNKKWLDDTDLEFEKLSGWGLEKVIHPEDVEMTRINWTNSLKTGNNFDMECRILNKEGEYRWHLSRALPIKDEKGKIKMWVGAYTEIHEQKEAKNKAEVATQIAESAVIAKQQFLSNMSHEIRTPMNAIVGFTNLVLKTQLNEKQQEYINAIKVSGDALIGLINDILDIAKVDSGKMTFEQIPFKLSTSISSLLHLFEPKIQEKDLELIKEYDHTIPEFIEGDSVRLNQIMLNLLSNAVKFTDKGKITVSVRILNEESDNITIEFSVTDTGIGIPENKLEHIFDDFQQATTETSRLHGGTGLGLSIVKQFVQLQGGTLIVNSKPGSGSTFGFVLKFNKVIAETTKEPETDKEVKLSEKIKNVRVLVAEDMPWNQLLIKIILKNFGFEVDIAENGKIAIEMLQENKYDIILMDLQMHKLDGFEATKHIRSKINSQIPIIALTADVTTVDVGKCEAWGMNDYISKPIDEKLLYNKIIGHLKKTN
jgi:PAS domain S-box-containing protein